MYNQSSSSISLENSIKSTKNSVINERILIPYYSLYSDRIVIHPRPFQFTHKKKIHVNSIKNLKKKKFQGNLSKTQKSIIKKRVTAWLSSIKAKNENKTNRWERNEHYPVFITVTLSAKQLHPDKEIKRIILDQFIKKLKSKFGIEKYFWKAERQKNGNIHFHLIVDKYCKKDELRLVWNLCQSKLGYIDRFEKKFKYRNPPSTDVKGVKDVDNFINYVLKYCLKDESNKKIEGRVFGMSDNIRNLGVYQDILDSELSDYLKKYMDYNYFQVYKQEYYTVLLFKKEFYQSTFYNILQKHSKEYYLKIYNYIYSSSVKAEKPIKKFKEKLITRESQLSLFKLSDQVKIINNYHYVRRRSGELVIC